MNDKILQIKKEMRRIIKVKDLTRMEKHELVKKASDSLSEKEKELLIKECYRDYEAYNRCKDVLEIVTVFLTGIGFFLTIYNTCAKEPAPDAVLSLTGLIIVYLLFAIAIVTWLLAYRTNNMHYTRYMLDVLEEKE